MRLWRDVTGVYADLPGESSSRFLRVAGNSLSSSGSKRRPKYLSGL
jgi:hypothetical protein